MEQVIIILYQLFQWVLTTSVMASVMVGLVLLIKFILKDKLNIRWHYFLWILVIARLILPWTPESSFSVFNLVDLEKPNMEVEQQITSDNNPSQAANYIFSSNVLENPVKTKPEQTEQSIFYNKSKINLLFSSMAFVWVIGVVSLFAYIFFVNKKFAAKVQLGSPISDRRIQHIFDKCKKSMRIKKSIPLIKTTAIKGPTLYGNFRNRLLLPEETVDSYMDNELMYIFHHELAHFKRKDIMANWIMTGLLILHWFNPILWYAYYRMREDQEMACDALALTYIHPNEAVQYGHTIIRLLENYSRFPSIPGVASFAGNQSQLKRRIKMIMLFRQESYKWSILGLVIVILLSGCVLTDAKGSNEKNTEDNFVINQPERKQIELNAPMGKKFILADTNQEVIGIQGRVALLDVFDHFVAEDKRRVSKLMIYYWGIPSQLAKKTYRVEAMNNYGDNIILSEGNLPTSFNRDDTRTVTRFVPFPTEGKWQLSFFVGEKLHGEFTVEVLPPFPKTAHYIFRSSPKEIKINEDLEITIESSWNDKEKIDVRLVSDEGKVVDQNKFMQTSRYASIPPTYLFRGKIKFPKEGTWFLIIDGEKTNPFDININNSRDTEEQNSFYNQDENDEAIEQSIYPKGALNKVESDLLNNNEELIPRVEKIDNYVGIEYDEDELNKMAQDSKYNELNSAIKQFVLEKLYEEIERTEKVSENVVMVITKDKYVFKILLQYNEEYEIWLVNAVGAL